MVPGPSAEVVHVKRFLAVLCLVATGTLAACGADSKAPVTPACTVSAVTVTPGSQVRPSNDNSFYRALHGVSARLFAVGYAGVVMVTR